jgi:hypothetical protein
MRLRDGVADMYRRAEASAAINGRYAEALAAVEAKETLAAAAERLGRRAEWKGWPVRALNPLAEMDGCATEGC